MTVKLFCRHCRCRVGLWQGGAWKNFAGNKKKGCGRRLTRADVVRRVVPAQS